MYYILKCEEIMPQQFLSSQQLAEQQARMKEKIKENKLRVSAAEFFEKKKKEAKIELILGSTEARQLKRQQEMPGVAAVVNGRQLTLAQACRRVHHPARQRSARRRNQPQDAAAGAESQAAGNRRPRH